MSTFFYFAYGSNLLTKRIRINNKTAERVANGILKNYRLDFADSNADKKYYSPTWNGCPATIIPEKNSQVIGVIWKIKNDDLSQLDYQEGVEVGIYKPLTLEIESMLNGEIISCRSYQLVHNPSTPLEPENRCHERCPSRDYLNVVVNGAVESNMPIDYINFLKSFKHNGNEATNKELVKELCLDNLI